MNMNKRAVVLKILRSSKVAVSVHAQYKTETRLPKYSFQGNLLNHQ